LREEKVDVYRLSDGFESALILGQAIGE